MKAKKTKKPIKHVTNLSKLPAKYQIDLGPASGIRYIVRRSNPNIKLRYHTSKAGWTAVDGNWSDKLLDHYPTAKAVINVYKNEY